MEDIITLNQLIKRLYNYRAEHTDSGRKKITFKGDVLKGLVAEIDDNLTLE